MPQGFTLDDVIDFTPAIRDSARAVASRYRMGPLYTPPSMQGTITVPGSIGGIGWGGGAYDPETNTLYVKASNTPTLWRIVRREAPSDTVDFDYAPDLGGSALGVRVPGPAGERTQALPLNKPPYGTLTAIDMSTGAFRWQVPIGDSPGGARTSGAQRRTPSADARRVRRAGRDGYARGPRLPQRWRKHALRCGHARRHSPVV